MKTLKKIPKFKSEDAEREFWSKNDFTDFLDFSKGIKAKFPNLKPSTQTISLRLPESLLADIKILANSQDIPYQSYIKVLLSEKIAEKRRKR